MTKWQSWELRQLFPYMAFVYALIVPLWAHQLHHSFWWSNLILCRYNVDTLNICMKEFIIFVSTDSTVIFFSKPRSAGLNYNLPSFFTDSFCAGVSNKHCLLTFFICYEILQFYFAQPHVLFYFRHAHLQTPSEGKGVIMKIYILAPLLTLAMLMLWNSLMKGNRMVLDRLQMGLKCF